MFKRALLLLAMVGMLTGLISSPAQAVGTYDGTSGTVECSSGTFTVTNNVITVDSGCAGAVDIPEGVTGVNSFLFGDDSNHTITSVTIPASFTELGNGAFTHSNSLTEFVVAESNSMFKAIDGVLFLKDGSSLLRYPTGKVGPSYEVPSGVTHIAQRAFINNSTLNAITLPTGLTIIDAYSFYGTNFASMTFPSSLTTLGDEAFHGSRRITEITIPSSVTTLGDRVFIYVPLASIYFLGDEPTVGQMPFGNSVPAVTAYVRTSAEGFVAAGTPALWNYLVVDRSVYTASFDTQSCTNVDPATFLAGGSIAAPLTEPTRDGYTFAGWSTEIGGSSITFPYAPGVSNDITLFANWTANTTPPLAPTPCLVPDSAVTIGNAICDLAITGAADGTANRPYLVGSAKQLAEVNDCNDGSTYRYYRQIADIDLTPTSDGSQDGWNDTRVIEEEANRYSTGGWIPIGDYNNDSDLFYEVLDEGRNSVVGRAFSGSYDGNKKAISGLTINRDSAGSQGLFGKTNVAEIKNLIIGSVTKAAAGSLEVGNSTNFGTCGQNKFDCGVGAVAGLAETTNFKNIRVINIDISGSGFDVGGIAGNLRLSNATDVSFSGNITSSSGRFYQTGGIFGRNSQGHIKTAIVEGNITCDFENIDDLEFRYWEEGSYCGGIAGRIIEASISQAQFSGDVTASNRAGGIVGEAYSAIIESAEFKGNVYGSHGISNDRFAQKLGGIAGYFEEGVISYVVSDGNVFADASQGGTAQSVGGIVGDSEEAEIKNSVSNGDVRVDASPGGRALLMGGIVGEAKEGGIHNVVSNSSVIIDTASGGLAINVGGLVGVVEYLSVTSSFAHGKVEVRGANSFDNANMHFGGVAGTLFAGSILDVRVTGDLAVEDGENIGGIVGRAYTGASVSRSTFAGELNLIFDSKTDTNANVGGAIGRAQSGVLLSGTSVTKEASVTATAPFERVGGLIGLASNGVVITDSYNRAPVSGYDQVAGVVGMPADKSVTIYNTYNTGTVTANVSATEKDVFATGENFKEGLSLSNTFDTQTTGTAISATGVVGNSTSAMKTKSTFEALGFDFSSTSPIWAIDSFVNDGYPHLVEPGALIQPVVAPVAVAPATIAAAPAAIVASVETFKLDKFSKNSANISKANKTKIASYAKKLKAGGYSKITIRSFTTSENTVLANKRAIAVTKLLKKYGVKVVIRNEGITRKSKSLNDHVRMIGKKN